MSIKKQIIKDFGQVFIDVKNILDKPKKVISVSPRLDIGLNGGIPEGTWVIISGKEKIGKTTLTLTFCANAQKSGKKVYYIDAENRLKDININSIEDLDISEEKFQIIRSTQGNILTAEKILKIGEDLLKSEPNIVLVIDSTSSLCSQSEYDGEITSTSRNTGPKLLAQFTRKLASVVPVQDSIVVVIQHVIANTSGYGPAFLEDGGNKIKYQCDVKLRAISSSKWMDKEKQIGQEVKWDIIYSALGSPGASVQGFIRYGHGVDCIWEQIETAVEVGLIDKAGAWFNLSFLEEPVKLQGQNAVWNYLKENAEASKKLNSKIKEILCV